MSGDDAAVRSIVKSTRGMIFLGTPFGGSKPAATAENIRRILQLFGVDSQEQTLKLLGVDSESASELRRSFSNLLIKRRMSRDPADKIESIFFYERQPTKIGFRYIQVCLPAYDSLHLYIKGVILSRHTIDCRE